MPKGIQVAQGVRPNAWALPLVAGRFYEAAFCPTSISATAFSSSLCACPYIQANQHTWSTIAIEVTVAAGTCRLGYYDSSGLLGLPGALKRDFGTVDTSTTGAKSIGSLSEVVPPGIYWVVVVSNGAVTLRSLFDHPNWRGIIDPSAANTPLGGIQMPLGNTQWVANGLPKMFPLGRGSSTTGAFQSATIPRILIGV